MQDNAYFVVSVLDLFDGQLSADQIIQYELPFVNSMVKARQKLLEEKEKMRKSIEENARKAQEASDKSNRRKKKQ